MKGETIDYRTHVQYKILDSVEYILDHYSELDQEIRDIITAKLGYDYKPYDTLEGFRDILWAHFKN